MSDNLKKFNRNKSIPSNPPKQNKVYVVSFSDSSSGEDDNDNNNNYHQKLQTYSVKTYGNVKTDPRKLNYNNVQTSQRNQGYTAYQNIPMNIPNQNFFTMRNPVQVPNLRYNYYVSPITSNYAFPSTQNYNIDTYNRSLSGSNMNSNGNYSRAYYPLDVSFGNISGNVSGSIQNNMINPNPTVIPYQRPQSISFRSPNIKTYQSPVFNFKSKIPYAMDQIYSNKTQKDKNAIKIQKVVRGYNLRKNLYEYLARYMNQQALYKQQQQIPYQTQTLNSTSNYRQNYNIGINPNVQSYNPNQKFDSYSFGHTNYDLIGNNVSQNNSRAKNICFICKLPGHFAKECVLTKDICYECGYKGHMAKECQAGVREAKNLNYNRVKAIFSQQSSYKYLTHKQRFNLYKDFVLNN